MDSAELRLPNQLCYHRKFFDQVVGLSAPNCLSVNKGRVMLQAGLPVAAIFNSSIYALLNQDPIENFQMCYQEISRWGGALDSHVWQDAWCLLGMSASIAETNKASSILLGQFTVIVKSC